MTPVQLSRGSWHFWVASFGNKHNMKSRAPTDICSYTRAVFWGLGRLLFAVAGLVIVMAMFLAISTAMVCAVAYWLFDVNWLDDAWIPGSAFWMASFIIAGFVLHFHGYDRDIPLPGLPAAPSFLVEAWRAFKDKTCVRVELK